MNNSVDHKALDSCGCCAGMTAEPSHSNPPGLSAVAYRIGTHPDFLDRMKARIHRQTLPDGDFANSRPLGKLATRSGDDPSIALMDAWAVAADVLTFYQERIANEGFLRTATERRSVLELARAIGYELNPGVSASAYLVFSMDDADGAPQTADIPGGTQIQSIPIKQDELPQTFETGRDFVAHVSWNAMRPRREQPQAVSSSSTHIHLQGVGLNIRKGDVVLLVIGGTPFVKHVVDTSDDTDASRTRVDFEHELSETASPVPLYLIGELDPDMDPLELSRSNIEGWIYSRAWSEAELQAFLTQMEWEEDDVLAYIDDLRAGSFGNTSTQFFKFRTRAAVFGYNAPDWRSQTRSLKAEYLGIPESSLSADTGEWPDFSLFSPTGKGYQSDGSDPEWVFPPRSSDTIDLDRVYSGLIDESWVALVCPDAAHAFEASHVAEGARAEYLISAKTTRVTLVGDNLSDFAPFVRETTVHAENEALALASSPLSGTFPAGSDTIVLESMVLGLEPGQAVMLSGSEVGKNDFARNELVILDEITHAGGLTTLTFRDPVEHDYDLESLTLNANVVLGTHGETVALEVLGGGDGSRANQQFTLKKHPLTHTSAANARGSESSLEVRVNDVLWEGVESMYGLEESARVYVVRIDNDGNAHVMFGDGKSGARLPTGQENVTATYRAGTGSAGEVPFDSLTLLKKRPPGIRSVTNPAAASGAEDPETLDTARGNAPLTVKTLDRVVSLQDYEDYARAFAGIGKARVTSIWNGEAEIVHLTVADANGDEVVSPLYDNLLDAIEGARDPAQLLRLDTFQPLRFFVAAKILIDSAYIWEKVKGQTERRLLDAFGFDARSIAQPVSAAEVIQTIHGIDGVIAVDLDELYVTPPGSTPPGSLFQAVLPAPPARYNKTTDEIEKAHLLLIHEQGINLTQLDP